MSPFTLNDVLNLMGVIVLGFAVYDYGRRIWGRHNYTSLAPKLKKSVLCTLTDFELRELFQYCCTVRAAPFADQISTLPYQRQIDKIGEVLDRRCDYSILHRLVLDKLPIAPDVACTIENICLEGRTC
jgi:hypothetical protein